MYKLTQELVERFLHTHKHGVEGDFGYDPSSLTVGHTVCHNDMMSTLYSFHSYLPLEKDRQRERENRNDSTVDGVDSPSLSHVCFFKSLFLPNFCSL